MITIKDEFTDLAVSRQRKYQLRMFKRQRCVICGEGAVTRLHCAEHAIKHRERIRKQLGFRDRYHGAFTYQLEAA